VILYVRDELVLELLADVLALEVDLTEAHEEEHGERMTESVLKD
jgi:hypothetical protein